MRAAGTKICMVDSDEVEVEVFDNELKCLTLFRAIEKVRELLSQKVMI